MQLRTGNTVLIQFDTITDNAGTVLVSETAGEIIFHGGLLSLHPGYPGKVVSVNGQGVQFQDGQGNSTTINNTVQTADVDLQLPSSSGTLQV